MNTNRTDPGRHVTNNMPAHRSTGQRRRAGLIALFAPLALIVGISGCARAEPYDPLAAADALAPADGPVLTSTVPQTVPQTTTTSWPRASLPKLSTEPGIVTPPTTIVFDDSDVQDASPRRLTYEAIYHEYAEGSEEMDVLAWGDVDGDGYEDALVMIMWCGGSCGKQLKLIFNDMGRPSQYLNGQLMSFDPWFLDSGAMQSRQLSGQINGSVVTLTGLNLCGDQELSMEHPEGLCPEDLVRTATYQLIDGTLHPISIEPPVEW